MTFGTFKLKPKPEHLEGVLNVLARKICKPSYYCQRKWIIAYHCGDSLFMEPRKSLDGKTAIVLIPCRDSLFMELAHGWDVGTWIGVLIPCRDSLFMEPQHQQLQTSVDDLF